MCVCVCVFVRVYASLCVLIFLKFVFPHELSTTG